MSKEYYTPFRLKYSDITGDNNSALMLAQLEYWNGVKKGGWVVKSVSDWWNELRITPKQVKRIKAELETLGYIETSLVQWNNSQTTAYLYKKQAVEEAVNNGFDAYTTQPKSTGALGIGAKSTDALGTGAHSQKVLVHTTKRDASITEITTENTTEMNFSEINSLLPQSDFLKKEMKERIERNNSAFTKPKKQKEETDELSAEIHKYVQKSCDYFIDWFKCKYATPPNIQTKDIVNLKKTFRSVMAKDKTLTPERCFKGVQYFIGNFDKFDNYTKKKFSINHIATNWDELVKAVKDYKPPVERKNFNEPVPFVAAIKEKIDYYNTMPLPVGLSDESFRELGEAIYREKIMDGEVDTKEIGISQFTEIIYKQVRTMNQQQIQNLLDTYGIV
jgi:hypothetical protein